MDEIGNTCITLTPCPDLKYNDGNGTCLDCGTNCTKCANVNGKCLNCTTDNAVDFANPKNCNYSSCVYPIGPVGQPPVTCLSTRFSTTRLIPPFSTDAVEVDWRTWGIVQDMQDQEYCGSCWAFSSIGDTESAYAIATGQLYKFSEQHPVSCSTDNYGCDGGWPDYALEFYATQGTILWKDYPYISGSTAKDEACLSSNKTKMYPLKSNAYYSVPSSY